MARPSRIHETVVFRDAQRGTEETLPITEAICRYLEAGSFINHACEAVGLTVSGMRKWILRGEAWLRPDEDGNAPDRASVPESEIPYVEFVESVTRARARGVVFHELNLRRHADKDPRASMFFLERRAPNEYGRRLKVEEAGSTAPAPVDFGTAAQVEEAFRAALVPPEIAPESVLPPLLIEGEAEEVEDPADEPANVPADG